MNLKNKIVLYLISFILLGCQNIQENQLHTLIIKKDYCQIESKNLVFLSKFQLKKDGELINNYKTEIFENYFKIDSLKPGNYSVEFNSMFKRIEIESINIKDKNIDTLKLCFDKISYESVDHIPFVDKLNENESFEMNIYNRGCFSLGNATMRISKTDNNIIVEANNKKKKLTLKELEYLRKFELELINMNYGGCTTVEYYTLKYKDKVLEIKDGSCNWFGYDRLYKLLFDKKG